MTTASPARAPSPHLDAPLLSVEGLNLFVRQDGGLVPIVRDVSFTIAQGECFALIGESGSGKTMIARALMRLLPSALLKIEGRIAFEGDDITLATKSRMRSLRGSRIAMIFQEPMSSLNPLMTIGKQIDEAIVTHQDLPPRERAQLAAGLLADVRFKDPERLMEMYPHELSGGMRQRVMIAMAVSNRPALLIADEPTTALDVSIQAEVMDILARLRLKYKIAVLFISHDLSLVAQYADRVGVLYGGDMMEVATTAQIVRSPSHPYSAALMSCIPRRRIDNHRQLGIDGTVPRLAAPMPGCRFAPRCSRRVEPCEDARILMVDMEQAAVRCLRPLT
jgi:oligopeptide/dipeptide ABC transporter ATP-binding protein